MSTETGDPTQQATGVAPPLDADGKSDSFGPRLEQQSLMQAIVSLEGAVASSSLANPWYVHVREAVRACALALEHDLDSIDGAHGMRESVGRFEPRLLPSLEKLEGALAQALIETWRANEIAARAQSGLEQQLTELAGELRSIAEREFDLWQAALTIPGGEG
jgi:hypothetical protein